MTIAQGITILQSPRMRERTSIRLGGNAVAELRVTGPEGYDNLPGLALRLGGRVVPLGAGTNIIADDADLPLVLVTRQPFYETGVLREEKYGILIRTDGAVRLPALLAAAASRGLSGLEGLTGIPGNVGGAVAMNAGSYGVAIGERVHSVTVFSPLLGLVERPADAFDFSYRSCRLRGHEGWFLVCAVTFALTRDERDTVRARMRDVYLKKQAGQPVTAKSAGCVFKNPAPDAPAGRLLDEAGLKGLRAGGMRFSPMHANFLVNEGGGAFDEAMELIELARERVFAHSGHRLETEVHIWP